MFREMHDSPGPLNRAKKVWRSLTKTKTCRGRSDQANSSQEEETGISRMPPPANLLRSGSFNDGTAGWFGHAGSETITAFPPSPAGSPHGPPTSPSSPPHPSHPVSLAGPTAPYIICSNRHEFWQGPCHMLPRVDPRVTYAVSAWVRIGSPTLPPPPPTKVEMMLAVDDYWVPIGAIEAKSGAWARCIGAFRLEKKPRVQLVKFYFQGPPAGVDIWAADVRVVPQNPDAVIEELKEMAEKVRKRDVTIRVTSSSGAPLPPAKVTLTHVAPGFAIGSCMNQYHFRNHRYRHFFAEHFNFAVFENELKWAQMESARGQTEYGPADEMLTWLEEKGIPARGHCIFWDNEVPTWLHGLSDAHLAGAIDNRVVSLLSRYKGRFAHYDVNNEMLHGGYFNNRLGPGIITRMFQLAKTTDPNALLFVNDYSVEDGMDVNSSPEKYLESVQMLLKNGAPVDGIGIQAHITNPVPRHVYEAFETLAKAGLPIWLTELDVESEDEMVRADDFEMMLRVAFAHPVVGGVVLWGFWRGLDGGGMFRKNAHLVSGDWCLCESGKRLEKVVKEWSSGRVSRTISNGGTFSSKSFLGRYKVVVEVDGLYKEEEFVLERGEGPKVVDIVL